MLDEGALASGVMALLEARREKDLAALVGRSVVELSAEAERWTMGAREVTAYRVALVVSAEDHARLTGKPDKLEALRQAFGAAVRTPESELGSLTLVLALPPSGVGFHYAYRDAPRRAAPEMPAAEAVLGGAAALARAMGDKVSAEVFSRARIEDGYGEGAARPLRRFLVRLDPADFARTQKDVGLADRLMRYVRDAATTAADVTTAVFLGVGLEGAGVSAAEGPEDALLRALGRRGVVAMVVERSEAGSSLVVVRGDEVLLVDLVAGRGRMKWDEARVMRLSVPLGEGNVPLAVEEWAAAIAGEIS